MFIYHYVKYGMVRLQETSHRRPTFSNLRKRAQEVKKKSLSILPVLCILWESVPFLRMEIFLIIKVMKVNAKMQCLKFNQFCIRFYVTIQGKYQAKAIGYEVNYGKSKDFDCG